MGTCSSVEANAVTVVATSRPKGGGSHLREDDVSLEPIGCDDNVYEQKKKEDDLRVSGTVVGSTSDSKMKVADSVLLSTPRPSPKSSAKPVDLSLSVFETPKSDRSEESWLGTPIPGVTSEVSMGDESDDDMSMDVLVSEINDSDLASDSTPRMSNRKRINMGQLLEAEGKNGENNSEGELLFPSLSSTATPETEPETPDSSAYGNVCDAPSMKALPSLLPPRVDDDDDDDDDEDGSDICDMTDLQPPPRIEGFPPRAQPPFPHQVPIPLPPRMAPGKTDDSTMPNADEAAPASAGSFTQLQAMFSQLDLKNKALNDSDQDEKEYGTDVLSLYSANQDTVRSNSTEDRGTPYSFSSDATTASDFSLSSATTLKTSNAVAPMTVVQLARVGSVTTDGEGSALSSPKPKPSSDPVMTPPRTNGNPAGQSVDSPSWTMFDKTASDAVGGWTRTPRTAFDEVSNSPLTSANSQTGAWLVASGNTNTPNASPKRHWPRGWLKSSSDQRRSTSLLGSSATSDSTATSVELPSTVNKEPTSPSSPSKAIAKRTTTALDAQLNFFTGRHSPLRRKSGGSRGSTTAPSSTASSEKSKITIPPPPRPPPSVLRLSPRERRRKQKRKQPPPEKKDAEPDSTAVNSNVLSQFHQLQVEIARTDQEQKLKRMIHKRADRHKDLRQYKKLMRELDEIKQRAKEQQETSSQNPSHPHHFNLHNSDTWFFNFETLDEEMNQTDSHDSDPATHSDSDEPYASLLNKDKEDAKDGAMAKNKKKYDVFSPVVELPASNSLAKPKPSHLSPTKIKSAVSSFKPTTPKPLPVSLNCVKKKTTTPTQVIHKDLKEGSLPDVTSEIKSSKDPSQPLEKSRSNESDDKNMNDDDERSNASDSSVPNAAADDDDDDEDDDYNQANEVAFGYSALKDDDQHNHPQQPKPSQENSSELLPSASRDRVEV